MTTPDVKKLSTVYPLFVSKYETFTLDQEANTLEKMNSIIENLNRVGKVSNETVNQWNKVMAWVLDEGINEATLAEIQKKMDEGGFDELISLSLDEFKTETQTSVDNINSKVEETTPEIYVETFKRLTEETDDTGRIQRAFDSAPEGAEIVFDPLVHYQFTSVVSNKSLTVNLNGASMTVDPFSTKTPAFHFKGEIGEALPLDADILATNRTFNVPNASAIFAKNDHVFIGDNTVVPAWAEGNPGYTGRWEINIVEKVETDTVTLIKTVEFDYLMSAGAFVHKITKMLKSPEIKNSGIIKQVNPGVPSPSSNGGKDHIFCFEYCSLPKVTKCTLEGWQLHAVNFHRCMHGIVDRVDGKEPFRPEEGGHGYLVRYDACIGGITRDSYGLRVRHLVDWSKSHDGTSENNISAHPFGVSYYMHGTGCKRCKSINDKVLGGTDGPEGWAMGNPSFSADYDFLIRDPYYNGIGIAVGMKTGSVGMRLINPTFRSRADYVIGITRGAKSFILEGGIVENYHPSGTNRYSLLAQATTDGGTVIEEVRDITIRGTKFKGNGIVKVESEGTVTIEDLDVDVNIIPNSGLAGAIRVCELIVPTDLFIRRNRLRGVFDRGIYGSLAPTGRYIIQENDVQGYRTTGIQIRSAINLRLIDNTVKYDGLGVEFGYASVISDAIRDGAIVRGNVPQQTKQNGTYLFTGDGTTLSFQVPHTLIGVPKSFNVVAGNQDASDAEIAWVTPYSSNLTVRFKTAPAFATAGSNNVTLHWWAEC